MIKCLGDPIACILFLNSAMQDDRLYDALYFHIKYGLILDLEAL